MLPGGTMSQRRILLIDADRDFHRMLTRELGPYGGGRQTEPQLKDALAPLAEPVARAGAAPPAYAAAAGPRASYCPRDWGEDPRHQEVALYASWVGSMVEVALARGTLDPNLATMLETRRAEGNQRVFRAAGELGEPVRSYVARLIAIEDLLAQLPVK